MADLERYFRARSSAHFTATSCGHGRIETRSIWVSEALNGYLDFPEVHQAFLIERQVLKKKPAHSPASSLTPSPSRPATQASPQRLLGINRGHWVIENRCSPILNPEAKTRLQRRGSPYCLGPARQEEPALDAATRHARDRILEAGGTVLMS